MQFSIPTEYCTWSPPPPFIVTSPFPPYLLLSLHPGIPFPPPTPYPGHTLPSLLPIPYTPHTLASSSPPFPSLASLTPWDLWISDNHYSLLVKRTRKRLTLPSNTLNSHETSPCLPPTKGRVSLPPSQVLPK